MTLPTSYFDAMYAVAADPWGFADRWYEKRKYALTLAALPQQRYARAYEPGCSIGVLSEALADRCDSLLATDVAGLAVQAACARVAGRAHVVVEQRALPGQWPDGEFDLIVLSELLYYLDEDDLSRLMDRALPAVAPAGTLVAVHWRHPVPDYPRSGDDIHDELSARALDAGLVQLVAHREDDFLLDVYVRPLPGQARDELSVAARGGLVGGQAPVGSG